MTIDYSSQVNNRTKILIENQSIENHRLKRTSAMDHTKRDNKNRTLELIIPKEEIKNLCLNTDEEDNEDEENEEDKVF